ncbi:MAG TPA: hypothetical protein DCM40_44310, partial [Maribacter sp.]|nr:hypothetical protein [Maribacter sp.]
KDLDQKILIAFALATYRIPSVHGSLNQHSYPSILKYLFYRPGKSLDYYVHTSLLNSMYVHTSHHYWHYVHWDYIFPSYIAAGETQARNYSQLNKSELNHPSWISRAYFEEYMAQIDKIGEQRIYDEEIQMTVREIYDSVLDADYSSAIYTDTVRMFTPPCALRHYHWVQPNPDDDSTWSNPDVRGDWKEHYDQRMDDISATKTGEFTYSMANNGNYKLGFAYPCEHIDDNPVSLYSGHNDRILRPNDPGVAKITWPHITYKHWFRHDDIMYDMNQYTVMDYSLDDMVDKIDELPLLKNFFEQVRSPIIFNEKISMRPAPFDGTITGNLSFTDANRNNTWHGYYSYYKFMTDTLLRDTEGDDDNGESFASIGTSHFENHKTLSVPEFYIKGVLSGDTNNMPQDAPFRYQGANPVKCLTKYENADGLTDFSINKNNNLGIKSGSSNAKARLDKLIRTYGMAIARKDMLSRRIKFLNSQLQESLDWVDTQGDEYGYDQTMTAVTDD